MSQGALPGIGVGALPGAGASAVPGAIPGEGANGLARTRLSWATALPGDSASPRTLVSHLPR